MTSNGISQISSKVDMPSHFLGLVGPLPPPELFLLKHEYKKFVDENSRFVQESYTVQDVP
jgi:hypothetical protein